MIIAINTRCFNEDEPGECGNYIREVFQRITKQNNQHTFIFISSKSFEREFTFPVKVKSIITGPQKNTFSKWFIWYNIKIPILLKKYKADLFVSTGFCSLTTGVPQCLLLHDLSFLHFPSLVKRRHLSFYKRYTPLSLKKSKAIIAVSQFSKTDIIEHYKMPQNKIWVAYAGIHEIYQPVSMQEKEIIKEKYAGGNEYFIYTGEINPRNNLMNLLKAFSAFKKRQKSSMQLLITSEAEANHNEFVTSLKSYKFKNDVKLLTSLSRNENAKIIASGYAMVYAVFYDNFGTSLLKAMKCQVPLIISSTGAMLEMCGDAALYTSPENYKEIAVKMMLLFKDEKLRKDLIEKGNKQVQKFCWENAAKQVWDSIEKAMGVDNNN